MVAPHGELFDCVYRLPGFGGELRQGPVVVEAQHRGELFGLQVGRAVHRDIGVGIGRVADDQHSDVPRGVVVERLALHGENGAVGFKQVLALHALAARAGADQHGDLCILERDSRVVGRHHAGEQGERAVVEFHHHALARGLRLRQVEQLQIYRLVLAQHFAAGDAEQQAVADLPGGTGHGDSNRGFGHARLLGRCCLL
jgi:hypothetical protein